MIRKLSTEYPVKRICQVLDYPRSSYYHLASAPEDEPALQVAIQQIAGDWPTYGYRRITAQLRRQGWIVNSKRVRRLLQQLGLTRKVQAKQRRTTNSEHLFPRYPNLVRNLEVVRPDQVWVGDITYVRLLKEFVYLAVIMDVFTRGIRGWQLGRDLDQELDRSTR